MLKPLDIDALVHDRLADPEYAREYVKALGEEYRDAYAAFSGEIARLREENEKLQEALADARDLIEVCHGRFIIIDEVKFPVGNEDIAAECEKFLARPMRSALRVERVA